jgi:hypothetical protein
MKGSRGNRLGNMMRALIFAFLVAGAAQAADGISPKPSWLRWPLLGIWANSGRDDFAVNDTTLHDDAIALKVISTIPADGAINVAVSTTIQAIFSEAMDAESIHEDTFAIGYGITGTVAGAVTYDADTKRGIFTPSKNLITRTTYTATISSRVQDLAGNTLAEDYTWSFTTEPEEGISGGCFFGTAVSGSSMAEDIIFLREFRDKYLLTNAMGEIFVDLYYQYSPPIAKYIAEHQILRTATRTALMPVVYAIKYPMIFGFVCLIDWAIAITKMVQCPTVKKK